MSTLAIIDYGSGNVRSVARAVSAAAATASHHVDVRVTADPDAIAAADRIVLPGVGHFADCAEGLASRPGVLEAMTETVRRHGRPFLGVCVGMQLLADLGREDVETPGLGWVPGVVERIQPSDPALPVPHMGWNELVGLVPHPVLAGLGGQPHVYFTHSYAMNAEQPADVAAWCDYGGRFAAAIASGPIFGTQFHPEKSQAAGLTVLRNFLSWTP
jgi:glutamine amidotransferase